MFENEGLLILALVSTLVEGLVGVGISITYFLFNLCTLQFAQSVDTTQTNPVQTIALLFYSSYVTSGNCTYKDGTTAYTTNSNTFTKPNVIFIWQTVYLVLNIVWILSSTLLLKAKRVPNLSLVPWLAITATLIMLDLIHSSFVLTDIGGDDEIYNTSHKEYYHWVVAVMLVYCTRGILVWLYNILLLTLVLKTLFVKSGKGEDGVEYWTNKGFEDIRRELSNAGAPRSSSSQDTANQQNLRNPAVRANPSTFQQQDSSTAPGYRIQSNSPKNDRSSDNHPVERRYQETNQSEAIYQKPYSFKERTNPNQAALGMLGRFGYSPDGSELRRENFHPDQDVENAFNFLRKYEVDSSVFSLETRFDGRGARRTEIDLAETAQSTNNQQQGPFLIPRAKVPSNLSRSSSIQRGREQPKPNLKDYETRYYVPLKH